MFLLFTISRPVLGPTQHPVQWVWGGGGAVPPRATRQGREADPPPPTSADVKNRKPCLHSVMSSCRGVKLGPEITLL
jgi:hypothetical protein